VDIRTVFTLCSKKKVISPNGFLSAPPVTRFLISVSLFRVRDHLSFFISAMSSFILDITFCPLSREIRWASSTILEASFGISETGGTIRFIFWYFLDFPPFWQGQALRSPSRHPSPSWPQPSTIPADKPSVSASELPPQHHEVEYGLTHKVNPSYTHSRKAASYQII